jgi:hypothetical protein
VKQLFKVVMTSVALALVAAVASPAAAQDRGTVKVTVTRANIRADASEKSKVLAQVTQGMELDLIAAEGDWFHVRVPVSGLRVDAYISKKVSKIGTPPPAARPAPVAGASPMTSPSRGVTPMAPPPIDRAGMSVVLTAGSTSTPLAVRPLHVVEVADKIDTLTKAAAVVPAASGPVGRDTDDASATFVWVAEGQTAGQVVTDRRPTFLGVYKDLVGLNPDDLMPVLVKVTPAASGVRLVAALRGHADQASRTDPDWDVVRDLKQDIVKTDIQRVERGGVKLTPVADLAPGQYAIVYRIASKKKVAGSTLLGAEGEGKVFGLAWDFEVK